ncbi:hypothetical protein D3C87_1778830 [compost metagenome]
MASMAAPSRSTTGGWASASSTMRRARSVKAAITASRDGVPASRSASASDSLSASRRASFRISRGMPARSSKVR